MLRHVINGRAMISSPHADLDQIDTTILADLGMWPLPYDRTTDLEELESSIAQHGLYQPLLVSRIQGDNMLQLLSGRRRFYCLKHLKECGRFVQLTFDTMLHLTAEDARHDCLLLNMVESSPRQDACPMDYAEKIDMLMREGKSPNEIARMLGRSEAMVKAYARLMQLPPSIQQLIADRKLSMSHARLLQNRCPREDWEERGMVAQGMTLQQFDEFLKNAYS